jgi:hypothetical protein
MQGPDPADPAFAQRPVEPTLPFLEREAYGLRIAVAGGYLLPYRRAGGGGGGEGRGGTRFGTRN